MTILLRGFGGKTSNGKSKDRRRSLRDDNKKTDNGSGNGNVNGGDRAAEWRPVRLWVGSAEDAGEGVGYGGGNASDGDGLEGAAEPAGAYEFSFDGSEDG
jgi:hypothetical protein